MYAGMPEKAQGTCPECGKLFECYGASTLSLTIGGHLYMEHNYPTRFWQPRHNYGPGNYPAPLPRALPAAPGAGPSMPFDEPFYDGARLTLFDRGFLRLMKIAWQGE